MMPMQLPWPSYGLDDPKSGCRDFIFVLVADGVGTGNIFDGQVYRGHAERQAIGHMMWHQRTSPLLMRKR